MAAVYLLSDIVSPITIILFKMSNYTTAERLAWIQQQWDAGLHDQASQMLYQWVRTSVIKLPEFRKIMKSLIG